MPGVMLRNMSEVMGLPLFLRKEKISSGHLISETEKFMAIPR